MRSYIKRERLVKHTTGTYILEHQIHATIYGDILYECLLINTQTGLSMILVDAYIVGKFRS